MSSMDVVESIKNNLSIEEVVGPYVQMKKSGRNFKANCPFHNEKTPSFIISPDKGMAYCFGCRKGGDIFAFVQEIEGVDFQEAISILADKAGVVVPEKQAFSPAKKEVKDRLSSLLEDTHSFFKEQLEKHPEAQKYLENRDYSRNTQKKLELGFAPEGFHHLTEFLTKKGYKPQEMIDSGVCSQKDVGSSKVYDRFRNRVIFPIHTPQGKLVAFGGRTLSKETDVAKYLNSPETSLYHKGQSLYLYHRAKKALREQDQAIIVEGYFDALSAQLHGYPQTVASLGTALTDEQIKLIGRLTKNLVFAFDADTSGQAAASRSLENAQRLGFNVRILTIPSGKDPDEALRRAPEEWQASLENTLKATDYELQKVSSTVNLKSIEGKKAVLKHMLPIIKRLPNQLEQEQELKRLSLELETNLKSLVIELQKTKKSFQESNSQSPEVGQVTNINSQPSSLTLFVGLLLKLKKRDEIDKIPDYWWQSESEKNLYNKLSGQYNQAEIEPDKTPSTSPADDNSLHLLELYIDDTYQAFSDQELQEEVTKLLTSLHQRQRKQRLQQLRFQMTKDPQNQELSQEFQQLLLNQELPFELS